MKKLFLLAAGLALILTACQKDEGVVSDTTSSSSFTVTIPQNGTRAVTDDFGAGTSANRCILEIYRNDKLYNRIEKGVTGETVTFDDLRLVAQQTYDFVFWADCAEGSEGSFTDKTYNTANLKSITEIGPFVGNSDERDAFFAHETFEVTGSFSRPVTLKRPFGLLVVKTNDLNEIRDEALKPTGYEVAFKGLPTTFNALTGEVSGSADVSYKATEFAKTDGTISMDFLWATESGAALSDFTMTFYNGGTEICTNDAFTNIPIRRNYRTNVSGNLLTRKGTISVTIDPEFDENSPIEKVIAEVESAADVKAALESGATDIVVKNLTNAAGNEIVIPQIYATDNNVKISLTLPETSNPVTVKYDDRTGGTGNTEAPANITITANTTGKLTINTPESTVTLQGSFGEIDATTAGETLIVPEGVTVKTLNVNKGNVEIYGAVENIDFSKADAVYKVTVYAVGDAKALAKAVQLVAEKRCAKIVLTTDIDLQKQKWTPIDTEGKGFVEFDGAGHTIKNLYVDNATGQPNGKGTYYGGFFYVLQGNVKDLTIDGAEVTCYRGGTLVGRMDYGTVENCHMKNTTIKSVQKIGGLIGFVSTSSKDVTVRNCSVTTCSIDVFNPGTFTYCSQAAGLIGYFQTFERNVLIEGCSVSGITLNNTYKGQDADSYCDGDLFYAMEQSFSHAFIGNMVNVSKKADTYDKYTVELRNNKVDKQADGVATGHFTDEYMGWWASNFTAGYINTAKLIVDGVVKDRWTELKRFVALLKDGGNVNVWYHYDLTKIPETSGEIAIKKPTVIDFKNAVTLTVGKQQIVNKSELTVKGAGKMTATDYIFMNEAGATLTIENGTYTATKATDANGVVIYNQGICNIKNGTFDGPGFTLMNTGSADMTIENGNVINRNSPTGYALMAAGSNAKLTVKGGRIEAIQSIGGANVTISGGTILNDCKYYALYNEGGKTTITGGYFSGYPGMKDVYIAGGTVAIQGGYFEDNLTAAADGYVYKDNVQTVGGITYNYEVVAQ
ncbi:DUF6562 domain-containing protein [Alistipes dispar]|uniref:DUF6562 domain-containing protein n=1 Tax=Alistipes dispar TaxID=2585119 RepID=A0A4Y1X0Q4_9BACT|nr:DUF6562 domain-containing protein [Alistipes dispar]BBL06861.1 hypothetical protein A5CPEGH6_14990 [Alistipes dispar]